MIFNYIKNDLQLHQKLSSITSKIIFNYIKNYFQLHFILLLIRFGFMLNAWYRPKFHFESGKLLQMIRARNYRKFLEILREINESWWQNFDSPIGLVTLKFYLPNNFSSRYPCLVIIVRAAKMYYGWLKSSYWWPKWAAPKSLATIKFNTFGSYWRKEFNHCYFLGL